MTAPLTRYAHGSTICPGCNRRFANTPRATVDLEGTEENRGRVDSTGARHRGIGTHPVTRRWHADCLADFETQNEELRRQEAADREAMLRSLCEAAGLDFEEQKVKYVADRTEV